MKKKKVLSKDIIYFVILFISLLCGVIVGSFSAALIDNSLSSKLITSLTVNNLTRSTDVLISLAVNILKYPLITFLLGFTPLGVAFIPLTLGIKGYFFTFTIGAIIKIYGTSGILLSVSILGFQVLLLIPGLIILAMQCFSTALMQSKILFARQSSIAGNVFTKKYFLHSAICFVVFFILILIEFFITPHLISYVFSGL